METGKPELASAAAHMSSVSAQTERRMEIQAPLTAVYIHTVPALGSPPLPQPSVAVADPSALHLTMPPLYSKETLPFLTLHIASGLQPGLSVTASPPAAKPKSAGKHLCPHCGRDCLKPSVLEKHLRCHTGERPYPCTVCGVSFKTQSNLYKHKRTQAHARLSSESEQSSLSVDERSEEGNGAEKRDTSLSLSSTEKTPVLTQTLEINEKNLSSMTQEHAKMLQSDDRPSSECPPPSNRHVALQRQEATLFSKQWESSVSSSKSQSHESTDSGFSESSEHYLSPGSLLPDHSMDSLTETSAEHGRKNAIKEQENKSLEERITKLISQNSAVVEDKHLENVRPRKTALSKQGSIDLPMPYTYKDSFHFDMRISKMSNQKNRRPALYNSVPTQQSSSAEHAPLTRSNSLPFSVNLLQPDQNSPTSSSSSSSHQRDYTTLFRRGSSGQINNPTSFSIKSVNQQSSAHRPLVRQAAIDCNHTTDALYKNSSVEEACTGSLPCYDDPGDICGDASNRKLRRKKTQKFAYNKWYMYGGGTFKKLYEMENRAAKGAKSLPNPEVVQSLQKRLSAGHCETTVVSSPSLVRSATVHNLETYPAKLQLMPSVSLNTQTSHLLVSSNAHRMPLRRNLSLSVLPLSFLSLTPNLHLDPNKRNDPHNLKSPCFVSQSQVNIPSDRKKQRTDEKLCSESMETVSNLPEPQLTKINIEPNSTSLFPASTINVNALPVSSSPTVSMSTTVQNSFMPKYQLKLPNSQESNSSSAKLGSKSPPNISVFVSAPTSTSCKSDSTLWTHMINTTSNCSSLRNQTMPCSTSHFNVISPLVHQCPMADTKTTASLRNSHAGLFTTTTESSQFSTVVPTTTKNNIPSFTPIHRTQSSPAAFTSFPKRGNTRHRRKVQTPCQIVPSQQTVPKVFHVQTPDLQICLQIISDEQLALIEPQMKNKLKQKVSKSAQLLNVLTNKLAINMMCPTRNQAIGQPPALSTHPHVHREVNKVGKDGTGESDEVSELSSSTGCYHCPENNGRTEENHAEFSNEGLCFGSSDKAVTRANLQLSMVSLRSNNGSSSVGDVELLPHTEIPEQQPEQQTEQSHETVKEAFTYTPLHSQVEEASARADSFPNGWLSRQQHLQHLSQTHSGIYPTTDPLSGAVRVVQSSVEVEDSSSDDEGKLIIEL
ncbi:hypothetical protein WMY93_011900 [Mugilogobius chulae]|uniref:C2H2-type domain-containing protein n=1 Tax=Mugilogobius chulae TaxID=88201 RepID=A0AAW0PE02_9GOBI